MSKPKFEQKFKKRYVVKEIVGEGMCEVRFAHDANLGRTVALKQARADQRSTESMNNMLLREAQNTALLDGHPNIVAVHDAGLNDSKNVYFTMALVSGKDLSAILEEQLNSGAYEANPTKTLFANLQIFIKVCEAVAFAHHRNLINLDLKPENIRVGDFGAVYVLDWGVAVSKDDIRDFPDAVDIAGTVQYMSPEQANIVPTDIGEHTDVFCLGAILYELLSSWAPYDVDLLEKQYGNAWESWPEDQAREALVTLAKMCKVPHPQQRSPGRRIHQRIAQIAMKSLSKNPADRYQTVLELKEDIESFLICGWQFDRRGYPPGTVIIREGEIGTDAYIVSDGTCRVTKLFDGVERPLADLTTGDVFGEIGMLGDQRRSATVTAVDQVTLLIAHKEDLFDEDGIGYWLGLFQNALAKRYNDKERQCSTLLQEVERLNALLASKG